MALGDMTNDLEPGLESSLMGLSLNERGRKEGGESGDSLARGEAGDVVRGDSLQGDTSRGSDIGGVPRLSMDVGMGRVVGGGDVLAMEKQIVLRGVETCRGRAQENPEKETGKMGGGAGEDITKSSPVAGMSSKVVREGLAFYETEIDVDEYVGNGNEKRWDFPSMPSKKWKCKLRSANAKPAKEEPKTQCKKRQGKDRMEIDDGAAEKKLRQVDAFILANQTAGPHSQARREQ